MNVDEYLALSREIETQRQHVQNLQGELDEQQRKLSRLLLDRRRMHDGIRAEAMRNAARTGAPT